MNILGYMVVIKRTGADGTPIPLTDISCSIGRNTDCDIRVVLPSVSSQHCRIDVDPSGKAYITNVSQCNHTLINDSPLAGEEVCILGHKDIITIADRQFRWEYPSGSILTLSAKRDQMINYRILSPTTKSPVSLHNLNGGSGDRKRKDVEADVPLDMHDAKRKRVSFGPQLNPEHFDKQLPPATPISKGEKPNTQSLSLSDSPCLNANMRKSLHTSRLPVDTAIAEEGGVETPTKSLLRRRSPTPVKPYIARSLGLFTAKALDAECSNRISSDESLKQTLSKIQESSVAHSPTHDVPVVNNHPKMSPEKSPSLLSSESQELPELNSPNCPETYKESHQVIVTSKSPKSNSSRKLHKVIVTKAKKLSCANTICKSPRACKTSPKKVVSVKCSPKKLATCTFPRKLKTPEIYSKPISPKTRPNMVTTPKTSKIETLEASQKQVGYPKGTPNKAASTRNEKKPSPRATPKKVPSPKAALQSVRCTATPKKVASKAIFKRTASPKSTPKIAVSKVVSPGTTSKKVSSPKMTVKKAVTPIKIASSEAISKKKPSGSSGKLLGAAMSPMKVASPSSPVKVASPSSSPRKIASPKSPLKKNISPKLLVKRTASPRSPPKKVASPRSPSNKIPSPRSPPKKVASPRSPSNKIPSPPKKVASPRSPSNKIASPRSPPKKVASPRSPSNKIASPRSPSNKIASPKLPTKKIASPKSPNKKIASPKLHTKKIASPKSPNKKITSPKLPTKKKASPKSPDKITPPKSPSNKIASPKSPDKKIASPKSPSNKIASPKSPSKKIASPKSPSNKITSPKSPKKITSPKTPSNKIASPKSPSKKIASPKSPNKIASPKSPSKKITSPKSPNKITSPKSHSNKITSPKSPSYKIISPKSHSNKIASPKSPKVSFLDSLFKDITSPKSSPNKIASLEFCPSSPKKVISPQASPKSALSESFSKEALPKSPPVSPWRKASIVSLQKELVSLLDTQTRKSRGSRTPKLNVSKRIRKTLTPKTGCKKTPAKLSRKTPKKSWADVLKSGLMAHGMPPCNTEDSKQVMQRMKAACATRDVKLLRKHFSVEMQEGIEFGRMTTGHANSPAPIFIHKKTCKTPRIFRKGRKIPPTAGLTGSSKSDACLNGLAELVATPNGMTDKQIAAASDSTVEYSEEITSPKTNKRYSQISVVSSHETVKIHGMSPKPIRKNKSLCTDTPEYSKYISDPGSVTNSYAVTPPSVKTPTRTSAADLEESSSDSPFNLLSTTSNTLNSVPFVGRQPLSYISTSPSFINTTNFDFSSVKTPDVTEDNYVSPLDTPFPLRKTPERMLRNSKDKLIVTSPEDIPLETDVTTFDFENAHTPDFSQDDFVSPVSTRSKHTTPRVNYSLRKSPRNLDLCGMKILSASEPHVQDTKSVLHTPKTASSTPKVDCSIAATNKSMGQRNRELNVSIETDAPVSGMTPNVAVPEHKTDDTNTTGMREVLQTPMPMAESPMAEFTNVAHLKTLMKTPNKAAQFSPEGDYRDVAGVIKQVKTPKASSECEVVEYHISGIRKVLRTTKPMPVSPKADYTNVAGLKKLVKTPNASTQESPKADYTNVAGIKKLMKTPKATVPEHEVDDTHIVGIRKVLRTPKPVAEVQKADYTNVAGIKRLLKTPNSNVRESPQADYTNVKGMKKLLKTPKVGFPEHEADYTHVIGIRRLMKTPNKPVPKQHTADYSNVAGVKRLLRTPRRAPKDTKSGTNYSNVQDFQKNIKSPRKKTKERYPNYCEPKGLKKLLATPTQKQFSPLSDYTNVAGVKNIFASPIKSPEVDYTNVHGVRALMRIPRVRDDFVDVDLQGLGQILKTPLIDQTNVVVSRVVELADHSSTPHSGRKLRGSPKVVNPATSSPFENIPPLEGIKGNAEVSKEQEQDVGCTPRRSQRNAKVELENVSTPVRRGRSRKGSIKEADGSDGVIDSSVLKLIKTSPVVPVRRLRSKKVICSVDSTETVIRKKSKRSQKASSGKCQDSDLISQADQESSQSEGKQHKCYDDSDQAFKVATKEEQHSSPMLLPATTCGRRGKQKKSDKEKSTEPAPPSVENNVSRLLSDGKGDELTAEVYVSTRKRKKQTEADITEEQSNVHTPVRRGRSRRKAAEASEVSSEETSKVQAQSLHGDECLDARRVSPGIISENKPPPPKVRKTKVQEVTEVPSLVQIPSKEEVNLRRGRRKAAEKPETELEQQLRGRKTCRVQDKPESTLDLYDEQEANDGCTQSCTILEDSVPECQIDKRKRGKNRLKKVHEIVTAESSEDLLKATEGEQTSACDPSTKSMKSKAKSKSIKTEGNEHHISQIQTRNTRSKKENVDKVEAPPCKRRVHATTEGVETTRITRSRNKSTKSEDSPVRVTRQTRSRK